MATPTGDMDCVDVDVNGDVTINWSIQGLGTCNFDSLQIHCIQDGLLSTLTNNATFQFNHIGAGANQSQKHYFVRLFTDCNGTPSVTDSDTLSSIFLTINDLGDGRAALAWNPTRTPKNNAEHFTQRIYREYPTGTWTLIEQLEYGNFSLIDTIDICYDSLSYRVEVTHGVGCMSSSNITGAYLEDKFSPFIPEISSISVDTVNNIVVVNWDVNLAEDTYGYQVQKFVNGIWDNYDTVYGVNNNIYYDLNASHDLHSESYAIAAFDSCYNTSIMVFQTSAASKVHTTMYLTETLNLCELTVRLNWTAYGGWDNDVNIDRYDIIMKKGNNNPTIIKTVSPSQTSFLYNNLAPNENYSFYIRAVSSNGLQSYSNESYFATTSPSTPEFHYLSMASHLLSEEIELEFYTDSVIYVMEYEIERKAPHDLEYNVIGTIDPLDVPFYSFIDNDINQNSGVYSYRVNIIDTCGMVGYVSNLGNTIFLSIETDEANMINTLSWTGYFEFDGEIEAYRVFRGEDGVYGGNPIATINGNVRSYVDDLSGEFRSEGRFCYRIEAVEKNNSYDFSRAVFSNEVCVTFQPIVHIPNAIMVNGINTSFLPIINLYEFDSYHLQIYDRWGKIIFDTENRHFGWDGRQASGLFVQEGVYIYLLTFSDKEDKNYEYSGAVTVLFK